uniref:uncharacterized protein LOC105352053 n=1 Tax=Fragaria vesca subsp. vesca TaxID=101020 RepID=UPI0005CB78E3|nr:PREDICTED: uncharacterized protein LOC105352053 [Fragaria vesca subsp. vesca]
MKGRTTDGSSGQTWKDAKKMATMVDLWMAAVKEQTDDMLKKGSRRKMDMNRSSSENLVMKKEKLTERERKSINWVKKNYIEKILISREIDGPVPQQDLRSMDCGIFVMYYMDKLSK